MTLLFAEMQTFLFRKNWPNSLWRPFHILLGKRVSQAKNKKYKEWTFQILVEILQDKLALLLKEEYIKTSLNNKINWLKFPCGEWTAGLDNDTEIADNILSRIGKKVTEHFFKN